MDFVALKLRIEFKIIMFLLELSHILILNKFLITSSVSQRLVRDTMFHSLC